MSVKNMLTFTSVARAMPTKRPAQARKKDFAEIHAEFAVSEAQIQSGRCSQCGIPFCQHGCPLQNNIPDWLLATAAGRTQEAYQISSETNNMPEICGRICPQDRLCEGVCVIEQSGHGTVTIGAVEKYLTDTAWEKGWVAPVEVGPDTGMSVGIIGAGPAGLSAAEQLRIAGYQVTVYDRYDRAGGLLIYGIPNFKLDKSVLARRTKRLEESGIVFQTNSDIGASFAELRRDHSAILIATGVYKPRELALPELVGQTGVTRALDYLTASNRAGLGLAPVDDTGVSAAGRKVVVVGGGDTAMDCVRTAVRQGAGRVICLYRRDRENMPGSQREVAHAEEEGVHFEWLAAPKAIVGNGDGRIGGVRAVRMRLGVPDSSGRRGIEEIADTQFTVAADMVIEALGFEPEDMPHLFDEPELRVNRHGTIGVDHATMMTNLDGVFAAGDIIRGASLVVWAIKDGRDAAAGIHSYLRAGASV